MCCNDKLIFFSFVFAGCFIVILMKDLFPAKLAVKHLFVLAERVSQFYTENLQRLVSALLGDEA